MDSPSVPKSGNPLQVPLLPKRTARRVSRLLISGLTAVAALLSVLPSSATTVVALYDKRHHRVVLAADSLVEHYYAETSAQQCKLIVKPDCAFAMAGFLNKPDRCFHLQDLAHQAAGCPGLCSTERTVS